MLKKIIIVITLLLVLGGITYVLFQKGVFGLPDLVISDVVIEDVADCRRGYPSEIECGPDAYLFHLSVTNVGNRPVTSLLWVDRQIYHATLDQWSGHSGAMVSADERFIFPGNTVKITVPGSLMMRTPEKTYPDLIRFEINNSPTIPRRQIQPESNYDNNVYEEPFIVDVELNQ